MCVRTHAESLCCGEAREVMSTGELHSQASGQVRHVARAVSDK
jgi:hypothetical protein